MGAGTGGAWTATISPAPSPPQCTAGRSEQGLQPVICTWAPASAAPNRYLRMCFLLELAAVGVGAGRAQRNVAGQRVSLWLCAPLASRPLWGRMEQALAFPRAQTPCCGSACPPSSCSWLAPWVTQQGQTPARPRARAAEQRCWAAPISLLSSCCATQLPAWSWCRDASSLVFPLGRWQPQDMLLQLATSPALSHEPRCVWNLGAHWGSGSAWAKQELCSGSWTWRQGL